MTWNQVLSVMLVAVFVPGSLFRLWWIWWQSTCGGCGHQHRACVYESRESLMRSRR
jgi:hypothetical protein